MKLYQKIRDFFNSENCGFFYRKKMSGGVQILCGLMYFLALSLYVGFSESQIGIKIILFIILFCAAGDMILRGIHTLKMTKDNPGYVEGITEIDRDERGREMIHSAAYIALTSTYILGFAAALVLMFLDLIEAAIALLSFCTIQQIIFDIFRMCEEKIG